VPTLPLDPDVPLPPAPTVVPEVPVVVLVVALEVELVPLVLPPVDASGPASPSSTENVAPPQPSESAPMHAQTIFRMIPSSS
jgi:hypothetical protein